eukprot:PhF_6_TR25654/c0_g1_i1/m.36111
MKYNVTPTPIVILCVVILGLVVTMSKVQEYIATDDTEVVEEVIEEVVSTSSSSSLLLRNRSHYVGGVSATGMCTSMVTGPGEWKPMPNSHKLIDPPVALRQPPVTHEYVPTVPNCSYEFTSVEVVESCFTNKSVLLIGNSHLRSIAKVLVAMMGFDGEILTAQRHASHVFSRGDDTKIVFIWAPYSFREFLSVNSTVQKEIGSSFHHVIVNSGAWDMLFNDTDPDDYVARLHNDLIQLRALYPNASMTFMNVHMMHPADPKVMLKKMEMVTVCFGHTRLRAYRAMNLCAVRGVPGLAVWDNFAMTNTSYAQEFVRPDGHHYENNINFMMLRIYGTQACSLTTSARLFDSQESSEQSHLIQRCHVPNMTRAFLCRTLRWSPPRPHITIISHHKTYVLAKVKIRKKVRRKVGKGGK